MAEDPTNDKMAELQESLRRLETQLTELRSAKESGAPPPVSAPKVEPAPPSQAPTSMALGLEGSLAGAAVLCGVLVCALLLRRSAEASWVTPAQAPFVGIAYCALLSGLSAALFPRTRAMGSLLAHSALILGFLIVLETHFGRASLSLGRAQATLAALAVVAAVLGWVRKAPAVAGVGILGAAHLVAFLGPGKIHYLPVAGGLAVTEVVALGLAARVGWNFLRWPLFVLAQLFVLTWAGYLRLDGVDVPRLGGAGLGFALLEAPFVGAAAWQVIRARRPLDGVEATAPLVGTSLALLAMVLGHVGPRTELVAALSLVLLSFGGWRALTRNEHGSGGAFLLAGAVVAVWWWPLLPVPLLVSGAALSALGVGLFAIGRRADARGRSARSPSAVGHVVHALLVARLISLGAIFVVRADAGASVTLSLLVGGVATAQYAAARVFVPPRAPAGEVAEPDRESIAGVVAGAVAVFSAARVGCFAALHGVAGPTFQMCQSVAACVLIAGALGAVMLFQIDDLLEVAVIALVLYGAKIVFYDMFTLPAALAIPAVAALALVLALASFAIRGRKKTVRESLAPKSTDAENPPPP